ncbi:TonB family protein [Bdellovibrio bacteriovorus]|uniref:TonB family protein n=1 Tax=Bdellovibrio bacteriovorus TaxID=959 RepID=UPI0021D322DD|nr:TonB family protein [Bdellovibrio bacteriovorus]UXR65376.1 TonB family protein [Bdellovibrio bacteriovorus]
MKKSPSFRKYIVLSLALHVFVVAGFYIAGLFQHEAPLKETVSIDFLTPDQLQQFAKAEQLAQKKALLVSANQVVEQSETSANEEEVDTRFLSAKNQKVEKQTIAAQRGQFQNLKKAEPKKTGPKGDGRQKAVTKSEEAKKQIAKDLFKGFDASEAIERQKIADQKSGLGEGRGTGEQNAGTGAEASQSNDYVKDVNTGLETLLNTREFKYYSYYNRIRKQLSQHWEGRVREKLSKMFKEGRSPAAANQDRITKLMIVLNDKGTLVRVQVLSDSGVRDLDDAAIEAFRAAAPFPNPPKGIIEGDGTVKIRWDFVLET